MNFSQIARVFRKEVRETMRDRRTMIVVFAVPLIVLFFYLPYPWSDQAAGILFALAGSAIAALLDANGGKPPATGEELWKTDGTAAGTQLVKDLSIGSESGTPGVPADLRLDRRELLPRLAGPVLLHRGHRRAG